MRRPLHCLLVGFLVFSLSIDTARACWRLRHAHRAPVGCTCPVEPACGGWSRVVVVADVPVGHGWPTAPIDATVGPADGWLEEIACGQPLPCSCGDFGLVAEEYAIAEPAEPATIIAESPTLSGEIVTTQPAVTETAPPAETVGRPEPLQAVPSERPATGSVTPSRPVAPDDRPVEPTAANTPAEPGVEGPAFAEASTPTAAEMQPQPELGLPSTPEPESPAPPAEVGQLPASPASEPGPATAPPPVEPNLFEEVDAAPAAPAAEREDSADEPPREPPAAEPTPPPASEPSEPEPQAAPADNAPDSEPDPADADAVEPAAEPLSRSERDRRWIDASGRHAVVGRLVALLDGRAEIQKPDGRSISVPLDRLSPFDRAYVEEAGRLIAGAATVTARPTDTAGL